MKSAGAQFRAEGVKGATIPGIMKHAGLTVGGFYKHFASKSDLFCAMIEETLQRTLDRLRALPGKGREWRETAAAVYLSRAHRNNLEGGCPIPALAADIQREGREAQEAFESTLSALIDEIADRMDTGDAKCDRERAWAYLATLTGGLTLSRAISDDALAAEVLRACRHELGK